MILFNHRVATLAICIGCLLGQSLLFSASGDQAQIDSLMAIVNDPKKHSESPIVVADAINELGRIKALEAIPILIKHIDFLDPRSKHKKNKPYSIMNGRVAVDALVAIGSASVEPVLNAAKNEDKRIRLTCFASVLRGIEGKDRSMEMIRAMLQSVISPEESKRLLELKDHVKNPNIL